MNQLPKRKQIRLPNYDYSQNGYYFITICTKDRQPILSEICEGKPSGQSESLPLRLLPIGKIVDDEIKNLIERFKIEINPYIIMPDHIHMIIKINRNENQRAEQSPAPTSVCDMICAFKSITTKISNKKTIIVPDEKYGNAIILNILFVTRTIILKRQIIF